MSTYGATLQFLKGNFSKTYESEYFPGVPSGEMVDGVLSQDCTKTSFGDASLDLVTSNQVLEHVPNFQAALTEVLRVLRPGGAFIFSVPLYNDKTRQIAKLDLTQKVVFFGKPEFHDSRIGGPKSAPVFWRHGTQDIIEIIETSGFETELVDIWVTDVQRQPMSVIYARKPSKIGSM
jgi:ubiquinone/menaquinone biosynthesis C-methylase UbiE